MVETSSGSLAVVKGAPKKDPNDETYLAGLGSDLHSGHLATFKSGWEGFNSLEIHE